MSKHIDIGLQEAIKLKKQLDSAIELANNGSPAVVGIESQQISIFVNPCLETAGEMID